VGRVKRVQEDVAALKDLCRDLLAQKQVSSDPLPNPRFPSSSRSADPVGLSSLPARPQELIDLMRTSLAAQRSATQRLLASSGLPLMTEDDEAAYGNLKQVSTIPNPRKIATGRTRSDRFCTFVCAAGDRRVD
jgi:hypothetical protein